MLNRRVTNLVLTATLAAAGLMAVPGPAPAATAIPGPVPAGPALAAVPAAASPVIAAPAALDSSRRVGVFAELYRGRLIHGWGGAQPCAYIDGVSLGLVSHGDNRYSSTVNAYEVTVGVRETTRAAVRSLAGDELQPTEPPAYCSR
ncbi:hypothetical protein ACWT_4888 [Actinoplanes sp. SE50]|uniref:tyrosinase family oxidase copper chaperone n=1 Tax=unclassified Actinoplanes TaxID=2626549 RepID=UPI00023EC681|nr:MULTISPECIES: tyrosinase family oxidase copper chaperone [unclassified Actinoplanes]AEV85907.1 uncharacterized protein ACPL_5018 [Actinoplanes sp. SE50/110]ATO84303.1 hypothetical protein ACWT_4888 [Actinoplanes sp. SE50]SLM01713.1 hypothetical protein ACSP50_4951 [Actinoplanes sp. SE50/110]